MPPSDTLFDIFYFFLAKIPKNENFYGIIKYVSLSPSVRKEKT